MRNYYQILGLEINASKEDIKKAYRIYATKFHPDKQNGDKFFEERFKEILEAYEVLSDDGKRANYDAKWKNNFSSGSSQYYRQSHYKSDDELKKEKEQKEKGRQESEETLQTEKVRQERERQERETRKRKHDEKIKERKSKVFYTSKNLIVNGMYIYKDGKSFLLDDFDIVTLRKDDNSNFVFIGIFLIIIGVLTIAFFIGILFLAWGIYGLFYREYFVVLVNEKEDVPLVKGRKQKMKKIIKQISKAKELKNKYAT
jgi:DnaJ-domain-containing protein 1